jgi:flagellar biosynthesis/type III secretory pathway protein FliH
MKLWHPLRAWHADGWQHGYNAGYEQGLNDGQDFGKRIAYNQTLTKEIPRILSRYSQLQVKIMHKPKAEMQAALEEFTQKELDHFKMELQDR